MFDLKCPGNVVVTFSTKLYWSIAVSERKGCPIKRSTVTIPEWTIDSIETMLTCLEGPRLETKAKRWKEDDDVLETQRIA
jgi:hypothetical protein